MGHSISETFFVCEVLTSEGRKRPIVVPFTFGYSLPGFSVYPENHVYDMRGSGVLTYSVATAQQPAVLAGTVVSQGQLFGGSPDFKMGVNVLVKQDRVVRPGVTQPTSPNLFLSFYLPEPTNEHQYLPRNLEDTASTVQHPVTDRSEYTLSLANPEFFIRKRKGK
jgi:hypothetical protein